jgi:uncharacterized protein YjiK
MENKNGRPTMELFSKTDKIVFGLLGIVIIVAAIVKISQPSDPNRADEAQLRTMNKAQKKQAGKKVKAETNIATAGKTNENKNGSSVSIIKKWDLPAELKEVSGISYMDDERFVCVQDELGTVFVFNKSTNAIERKTQFAKSGDFEGIALTDDFVYVVQADGKLFEIDITKGAQVTPKIYKTSLTVKHNVEGFCYDKDNNRLLLAAKDEAPDMPGFKGIYAFDLKSKRFVEEPVFKIDLNHELIKSAGKKAVSPSGMAIHPSTKDIYITDGPQSKLLVMDNSGNIKKLLDLGKDFSQPEGITFSPSAEIFISNEGTKQAGNIIMVDGI